MLPYFPLHRPYYVSLCRYLLPPLRCLVFVRKTAVISLRVATAVIFFVSFCPHNTGICSSSARMVFLWQLQPFLSFPAFLHHILQNSYSSTSLSFVLLFLLSFFFLSLFIHFVSYRFVVFSYPALALHLLYLDELRLFGYLCFTAVVCDNRICISLG